MNLKGSDDHSLQGAFLTEREHTYRVPSVRQGPTWCTGGLLDAPGLCTAVYCTCIHSSPLFIHTNAYMCEDEEKTNARQHAKGRTWFWLSCFCRRVRRSKVEPSRQVMQALCFCTHQEGGEPTTAGAET